MNLTAKAKILLAADAAASGTDAAEVKSAALDLNNAQRATVLVKMGSTVTNAGTLAIKVYEGNTAAGAFTEVEGYAKTITFGAADAKKIIALDLPWIAAPYIKVGYQRGAQASIIDTILVFAYEGRVEPVTQDPAMVKTAEVLKSR